MIFGGSGSPLRPRCRPEGSRHLTSRRRTWTLGAVPIRSVTSADGRRQVLILGHCGATDTDLRLLRSTALPEDVTWRWPGAYTVIEESEESVVVHTDPASACTVYLVGHAGGWVWCSSARALASLVGAAVDTERLACSILLPSLPALAAGRSFFTGIEQLAPGSRVVLPTDGSSPRTATVWRPDPDASRSPVEQLRTALYKAPGSRCLRRADQPPPAGDVGEALAVHSPFRRSGNR